MEKEKLQAYNWDFLHFSPDRGNLPVLYSDNFDEAQSVDILTNGGAQLMNSDLYARRYFDSYARSIVQNNERAVAGVMLAYSKPQDRVIFTSDNAITAKKVFSMIADSYEAVDLPISRNFIPVMSLDSYKTDNPVLPNVLSREAVRMFANPALAEPNARFYRKDQHQKLWQQNDLPTPKTSYVYHELNGDLPDILAPIGAHQQYVVNAVDGSGGFNTYFVPYSELPGTINTILGDQYNDTVQIQGELPIISSPSVIANVSDRDINIVLSTKQTFRSPGVYNGSVWHRGIYNEIKQHEDIFMKAFAALQKQGVRGQMNIDLLFLDADYAQYMNISPVLLREANIRPSGSSPINRLKEARINSVTVDNIHLKTNIKVPLKELSQMNGLEYVNTQLNHPLIRAVLYNYDFHSTKASVAFLGAENVSDEEMKLYEEDTLRCLYTR